MFEPNSHYPLNQRNWNPDEVHQSIQNIVDDHVSALMHNPTLPRHPMDAYDVKADMYMGLAGVVWGVCYLAEAGVGKSSNDLSSRLDELLATNEKDYKNRQHASNSSYLFGNIPILMQKYKLLKDRQVADDIFKLVELNNVQPIRELMWGTAGTMLCANFMHSWTKEPRWKDIFLLQANRMLEEWESIEGVGHLWTPDLYGSKRKYMGPVHGFAGNIIPLIEGKDLLGDEAYQAIALKVMSTVVNTAYSDEKYANWPAVFDASPDAVPPRLLQHCHGAAGMITALSKMPVGINEDFDRILEKGGELVWHAGPLKKGANLCHGTAGNGYAFLKLYERTGDRLWIDRAQAFAMNCIDQYQLSKEVFHQGRYTLWTGDLGTAFFLWDCITEKANFPTIDIF